MKKIEELMEKTDEARALQSDSRLIARAIICGCELIAIEIKELREQIKEPEPEPISEAVLDYLEAFRK
jgi:hypothetical protein